MNKLNNVNSREALVRLVEGNKRFASGVRSIESFPSPEKMKELAENGQKPFAILLSCSDSRVPAETIFDCGLGDLFVIRVAGNIVTPALIASIEFAALNFGSPLCLVMGHSQCGAIKAAIDLEQQGGSLPSHHLRKLVSKVTPAVRRAMKEIGENGEFEDLVTASTWANVRRAARLLEKSSPLLAQLIQEQKLQIRGAVYDLPSGHVQFDRPAAVADGVSLPETLATALV